MGSNGNKKNQQSNTSEKGNVIRTKIVPGQEANKSKALGIKLMEPMEELRLRLDRMDQHAWLFKVFRVLMFCQICYRITVWLSWSTLIQ